MLLKNKLILNGVAVSASMLLLTWLAVSGISKLGTLQDTGYHEAVKAITATNDTYIGARMYSVVADAMINRDLEVSKKEWLEVKDQSLKSLAEVEKLADQPEELQSIEKSKAALAEYINLYENQLFPLLLTLPKGKISEEVQSIDGKIDTQKGILEENMRKISASMKADSTEADIGFDTTRERTLNWFLAIVCGVISLVICASVLLIRSIVKSLGADPNDMYDTANRIANGDLDFTIPLAAGDSSSSMAAMVAMQGKIKLLVTETAKLSQSAVEGKLAIRADTTQHQGDFRKVLEGVNVTLDAVVTPLNMAAICVESISKGNIPNKITDNYNGDFNAIKNNLNACVDAVNKMAEDANMLAQGAIEGKLSNRADASQHQGDFRKIIEGVNHTLDAVITPLNMAAGYVDNLAKGNIPVKITDSYNGDFNVLKNNLNTCIDAISLLVKDANKLAQAAQDDRLDVRADASQHHGDYRKVIEGVNGTLDTVMEKNAADAAEKAKESQVLAEAVEETQGIIEGAKTGDLSSRVPLAGKTGAIASLCDGVNALMDKMTEVIVQVREAGETINTAAGEISSGNNDLSQRTEQQASSLEETAASMEELASTVKNNAENAKQANQLAAAASGVAIKGGEVVGQVVNTMSAINTSAKKIEDIISVIDGIAFQTNILALNAAVEAARAGEQGRGFAVVAGEVRNLAQRSASAAKEIKELISDSVSKTAEGTSQVEQAGKTMQEIVSSVQRVTDIMGEITAASVEQSSGIDQVNQAVTSMDEVTQQNAALVEEAAAAAESLVEQAESLIDVVSAFKLSGGNSSSTSKSNSREPVRLASSTTSNKPATKPAPARLMAKTGTDDNEWEEF
jgi:methyl-accepting chemotaxis protein